LDVAGNQPIDRLLIPGLGEMPPAESLRRRVGEFV
jgi:hypothetical protein